MIITKDQLVTEITDLLNKHIKKFDMHDKVEVSGNFIQCALRDWNIPKEYEDQIRSEDYVETVMKAHKEQIAFILQPYKEMITFTVMKGDKNWVDIQVNLQDF